MSLDFLKTDSEAFARRVESEDSLTPWIFQQSTNRSEVEKQSLNQKITGQKPDTDEKRKKFVELKNQIDPSRKDVETWVDLIDLEEGRLYFFSYVSRLLHLISNHIKWHLNPENRNPMKSQK